MEAYIRITRTFSCNGKVTLIAPKGNKRNVNDKKKRFAPKGTNSKHSEEKRAPPRPSRPCEDPPRAAGSAAGAASRRPGRNPKSESAPRRCDGRHCSRFSSSGRKKKKKATAKIPTLSGKGHQNPLPVSQVEGLRSGESQGRRPLQATLPVRPAAAETPAAVAGRGESRQVPGTPLARPGANRCALSHRGVFGWEWGKSRD